MTIPFFFSVKKIISLYMSTQEMTFEFSIHDIPFNNNVNIRFALGTIHKYSCKA
jgi:hypothetical protein